MQIEILFQSFLEHGRFLRGWSPRTVAIYQSAFESFATCLRDQPGEATLVVGLVTRTQLDRWVSWMRRGGLTPGGCNVNIRSLNSFLSWLHDETHLPLRHRVRLLPKRQETLPAFTEGEVRSLASFRPHTSFQSRSWVLVLCLLDTGIRIDEALGLEQGCIDFENLQMRVLGKGNKERIVPFSHELRRQLYRLITKAPGRFAFQTRRGQRLMYRNVYRDIKRVCEMAGVTGGKVHPHAFRHFFAVNFLRQRGDIYRLSRILGHTSISTTQLYLRSMTAEQVAEGHRSPLTR